MPPRDAVTRRAIVDAHRETLAATVDAARTVAAAWPGETVRDPSAVAAPLEGELRERGLVEDLLATLDTAAAAIDESIRGAPVPAPPYLSVTSRGPVCRATLSGGDRLVVEPVMFAVDRRPARYRFADPDVEECLRVRLRPA
ncbi:hypothetical protein G9464_03850 [Halostella sp. JP-L12]|uniref:hypothetical protein n=1 Tax=Halostella TaxID=1843185 RepID=UPI0013CE54CE|nr:MULTISPECIES: hypothetical protein [Halostella]NHN46729.1 hypothetical protein [Halostella sp. JP-L12]